MAGVLVLQPITVEQRDTSVQCIKIYRFLLYAHLFIYKHIYIYIYIYTTNRNIIYCYY